MKMIISFRTRFAACNPAQGQSAMLPWDLRMRSYRGSLLRRGFCSGQNEPKAVASFGERLSTSHSFAAGLLRLTAESHKERLLGDAVLD